MQEYKQLVPTEPLNKSIPEMQQSLNSAASNFSGTAFPTENLFVGMHCVRTDLKTEYVCTNIDEGGAATWQDVNNLALHAGEAQADEDGNRIKTTYLKKEEAASTYLTQGNASSTYLKQSDAANSYYPKSTGEALASDVQSNVQAVNSLEETVAGHTTSISGIKSDISGIREDIADVESSVGSIDIAGKQFTVTASTQAAINASGGGGSANSHVSVTIPNTVTGIAAGTYTLQTLIQELVNRSHAHTKYSYSNCNCNCDNTC